MKGTYFIKNIFANAAFKGSLDIFHQRFFAELGSFFLLLRLLLPASEAFFHTLFLPLINAVATQCVAAFQCDSLQNFLDINL